MPIYEFYSPDTHRIYSFYARTLAQGRATPRCPDNPKARMERLISRFAVTGRAKEKTENPAENALDPRTEQAMAEMEREISTMNTEHPDPRQIGRLMRQMTAATGRKLPETLEHMIQRLEKGEDPERLEEEYGDSFADFEQEFGAETAEAVGIRTRKKAPVRDPKLYEMGEYL